MIAQIYFVNKNGLDNVCFRYLEGDFHGVGNELCNAMAVLMTLLTREQMMWAMENWNYLQSPEHEILVDFVNAGEVERELIAIMPGESLDTDYTYYEVDVYEGFIRGWNSQSEYKITFYQLANGIDFNTAKKQTKTPHLLEQMSLY